MAGSLALRAIHFTFYQNYKNGPFRRPFLVAVDPWAWTYLVEGLLLYD